MNHKDYEKHEEIGHMDCRRLDEGRTVSKNSAEPQAGQA